MTRWIWQQGNGSATESHWALQCLPIDPWIPRCERKRDAHLSELRPHDVRTMPRAVEPSGDHGGGVRLAGRDVLAGGSPAVPDARHPLGGLAAIPTRDGRTSRAAHGCRARGPTRLRSTRATASTAAPPRRRRRPHWRGFARAALTSSSTRAATAAESATAGSLGGCREHDPRFVAAAVDADFGEQRVIDGRTVAIFDDFADRARRSSDPSDRGIPSS